MFQVPKRSHEQRKRTSVSLICVQDKLWARRSALPFFHHRSVVPLLPDAADFLDSVRFIAAGGLAGMDLTGFPRRRKSHGQRIRGCRKSRECLLAFDCSSSLNRSRGFGLENGGGGRKTADLQITTLKSKRAIPAVQSAKQRRIYHPLVLRRVNAPFASAPCAPGVQGYAPAALFPRFLSRERNRAAGGNPVHDA